MIAWQLVGEARTPDGVELRLTRRDDEFLIQAGGAPLMSSRLHGSEEALATLACRQLQRLDAPRVLVGGLGMGFTLRAALDALPPKAHIVVAELLPAVVEWNRGPLGPLARHPLDDPRVHVDVRDVAATLRLATDRFDAVLLDVDNGPSATAASTNAALYDDRGVGTLRAVLAPNGVVAVWSRSADRGFEQRLRRGGFTVDVERVRGRLNGRGPRHVIYLATAPRIQPRPRISRAAGRSKDEKTKDE